MTPEQRLRWIQRVERQGFTVETDELRGVLMVSIRDGHGYVVRVIHPRRYDFEQAVRKFYEFQQAGARRYRTRKVAA